jgi:Na+/proline symporter
VFSILIAQSSSALGQSLIEAVNVLGSLFYGVILGIFLVAFYFKKINGTAVFIAAVIVECFVVVLFFNEQISFMNWLPDISFLWMNVIGAIGVVFVAALAEMIFPQKLKPVSTLQPSLSSLED